MPRRRSSRPPRPRRPPRAPRCSPHSRRRSGFPLSTPNDRLIAFGMRTATEDAAGRALFLKRWLRRPLAMGAFLPSGPFLGEAIARATLAGMNGHTGHVIELGAGTGEVTKALLAAGIPADRL